MAEAVHIMDQNAEHLLSHCISRDAAVAGPVTGSLHLFYLGTRDTEDNKIGPLGLESWLSS